MDFIKEFGKQFTNVARSVTEKSKDREGGATAKLSADIQEAEAALERLYARYGRACFDLSHSRGSREAAEALAVRIQAARLELAELTECRDAARELKRCLSCGAVHPKEARFCSACGKRLPDDPPRPEPVKPGEYCPRCGALREDAEPLCPVCGAAFDAPAEPSAPAPEPIPDPAPAPDVEEPEPESEE